MANQAELDGTLGHVRWQVIATFEWVCIHYIFFPPSNLIVFLGSSKVEQLNKV